MKDGLEEFLKRIEEKPTNETLIDRFISLVLEEDGLERILYLKKLVGLLLSPNPYAALKVAALELQEARKEKLTKEYEIGALKDVESCFLKLDKTENAALVREEINKLNGEGARNAVPTSKKPAAKNPPPSQVEDDSPAAQNQSSSQDLRRARLHFRLPRQDEEDEQEEVGEFTQQEFPSPAVEEPQTPSFPQTNRFELRDDATERLDMDALHPHGLQRRDPSEHDPETDQPFYLRRPDAALEPRRSSLSQVSGLKLGPNLLDDKAGEELPKRSPISVFDPSELLDMTEDDSSFQQPFAQDERTQIKVPVQPSESSPTSKDMYDESQNLHFAESAPSTKKELARAPKQPQARPPAPQAPAAPHNVSHNSVKAKSPEPAQPIARRPGPAALPKHPEMNSRPSRPEPPVSKPVEPQQSYARQTDGVSRPEETPFRTLRIDPQTPGAPPPQPSRGMVADEATELLQMPSQPLTPELEFSPSLLRGGPSGDSGMKTMVEPAVFPPTTVGKLVQSGTATRGQPITQVSLPGMVPPTHNTPSGIPVPQAQGVSDEGDSQRILRWDLLRERMRLLSGIQINRSHVNDFVQRLTGDQNKELMQRAMGLIMSFVEGREIPHLHQKISALLFEELEPRAMHQLWVSLRMQEMGAHFCVAYLHEVMRTQQYRRALNIIHAVILPGLDGHWYRLSYDILIEIWERLGLKGWAWIEEEGPLLFCERLARREDLLPSTLLA
jgi:hypothetical protein